MKLRAQFLIFPIFILIGLTAGFSAYANDCPTDNGLGVGCNIGIGEYYCGGACRTGQSQCLTWTPSPVCAFGFSCANFATADACGYGATCSSGYTRCGTWPNYTCTSTIAPVSPCSTYDTCNNYCTACIANYTLCGTTHTCVANLTCLPGQTFNPCTNACEGTVSMLKLGYDSVSGTSVIQSATYPTLYIPSSGFVGLNTFEPNDIFSIGNSGSAPAGSSATGHNFTNSYLDTDNYALANTGYVKSLISAATSSSALWGGTTAGNIWSLNSGNVGIGTTVPNHLLTIGTPETPLGAAAKLGIYNAGSGYMIFRDTTNDIEAMMGTSASNLNTFFGSFSGHDTALRTDATDRLIVKATSGNVGIGTTAPGQKLDVAGNIALSGALMSPDTWGMKWNFAGTSDTVEMNQAETAWKFNVAAGGVTKYRFNTTKAGSINGPILDLWLDGKAIFYGNVGIGTTAPNDIFSIGNSGSAPAGSSATGHNFTSSYLSTDDYALANTGYVKSLISAATSSSALWGGTTTGNIWSLASGNVGIGTTTPGYKLDIIGKGHFSDTPTVDNGVRYTGTSTVYFENIALKNNGSIPNGYIKFVTPIRTSANQMFSIDITGYDYNLGKSIDFTVVGYAYASSDTVINIGFANRSSFSRQVRVTLEDRGAGYRVLVVALGTSDGSGNCNDSWYYQKFGATVRLWAGGSATYTADQFTWANGETSLAAGYWQSAQLNNQVFDGQPGTISTLGNITSTAGLLSMSGSGNNYFAGNVGIGTASPVSKLQITSTNYLDNDHSITFASANGLAYYYGLGGAGTSGSEGLGFWGGTEASAKTATNTHLFIKRGGNVGIGTTTPASSLQIVGSANTHLLILNPTLTNNAIYINNASTGNPIRWSGGSYIGDYSNLFALYSGSKNISFRTYDGSAVQERLYINASSGNVGIGTTVPNDIFSIGNSGSAPSGSSATGHNFTSSYLSTDDYALANTGYVKSLISAATSSSALWGGATGGDIWSLASGNVGIGTNAPVVKLTLQQADQVYAQPGDTATWDMAFGIAANTDKISGMDFKNFNSAGQVRLMARNNQDDYVMVNSFGSTAAGTIFGINRSDTHAIFGQGVADASKKLAIGTFNAGDLILGTSNTERVRILSTGNVGIGTTGPESSLHVNKSAVGAAGPVLFLDNSAVSTLGNSSDILFATWTNESAAAPGAKISLVNTNAGTGANAFTFFTKNSSGAVAERVRFDSQGNVGIGTNNPAYNLDITGGSGIRWTAVGNNSQTVLAVDRVQYSGPSQGARFRLYGGGVLNNQISSNPSDYTYFNSGNVGIGTTAPNDIFSIGNSGSAPAGSSATGHNFTSSYLSTDDYALVNYGLVKTIVSSATSSLVTVARFVGATTATYNGDNSGNSSYSYAHAQCAAAYAGSHVCASYEILNTISSGLSATIPASSTLWIFNGPPAFTANANDCYGRTSALHADFGAVWVKLATGEGFGSVSFCDDSRKLACCK